MSLSKRLYLRSDTQNRDSFSERIWDDFCEEILQYLELEDKFRLQCVSKQFQRTVFQKQFELKIYTLWSEEIEFFSYKNNCFNFLKLETLLKKFPNITSIEFMGNFNFTSDWIINFKGFNDLIIKYCNNLVEFKCGFENMSEVDFNKFHEKFGSKLKVLKYYEKYHVTGQTQNHLKRIFFPLLQSIDLNTNGHKLAETLSQLNCPRLKKLSLYYRREEGLGSDNFIFDNCQNLRHLIVYDNKLCSLDVGTLDVMFMNEISKLKDLNHLKVEPFIRLDQKIFFESFKQIANNCRNLKSIECSIDMNWRNGSQWRRLMSLLKEFKQLKRLKLKIINLDVIEDEVEEDNQEGFSFALFEGLPRLTHLSLQFGIDLMSEGVLKNISNYLPNLQHLEMTPILEISPGATILVAHRLSQLLRLETINLKVDNEITKKRLIQVLIRKCKKLRQIYINCKIHNKFPVELVEVTKVGVEGLECVQE